MWRPFLLLILFALVVRAIWRLVGGVVAGVSGGTSAQRPASPPAMKMARDPVCGTYVVPGKARELARGSERLFFCSDECRTRYIEGAGRPS